MYINFMPVMTVSEARAALPEVLNRVAAGEEITITRHGQPVAVMVRPDILWSQSRARDVFDQAERLQRLIEDAGTRTVSSGGLTAEYAEELIADIRAGRDARGRL
jgi:antitoxin (DNA-binding transcriptional repressor) of toxin-antitoxin stability system